MTATIFLMCQGEQRRLADLGYPKQLVYIDGEPLLHRTLRQLRNHLCTHDADIYIVARHGPLFHNACVIGDAFATELAFPGICIVDGIREVFDPKRVESMIRMRDSYSMKIERWYVMLGDVAWTDDALAAFIQDDRDLVFAGTPDVSASQGEVFGLATRDPAYVRELADTCPCRIAPDGRVRTFRKQMGGHLRRLLWHAQTRLGPEEQVKIGTARTWAPALYLPIDDATDDVDTPADVSRLPDLAKRLRVSVEAVTDEPSDGA